MKTKTQKQFIDRLFLELIPVFNSEPTQENLSEIVFEINQRCAEFKKKNSQKLKQASKDYLNPRHSFARQNALYDFKNIATETIAIDNMVDFIQIILKSFQQSNGK